MLSSRLSSSLPSGTAPFCLFCVALLSNRTVWICSDLRNFRNILLHLRRSSEQIRVSTFQRNFITEKIKRRKMKCFFMHFAIVPSLQSQHFWKKEHCPSACIYSITCQCDWEEVFVHFFDIFMPLAIAPFSFMTLRILFHLFKARTVWAEQW